MPRIPYVPEAFPPQAGPFFSKRRTEDFTWAELVHAAITVGRRNWSDVLQHGSYSALEILWRIAMLRANLRTGPRRRLVPSAAYRRLDRSEKGAISFFIGLCMAKAFSMRLLQVPWLLHLSTYQTLLNPSFVTTDRPDFVGFDATGRTVVIEAKGRTGGAPNALMAKAKRQTQAIGLISGVAPTVRIAMAACFSIEGLRVRMADPTEPREDAVNIDTPMSEVARIYYAPLFDVAKTLDPQIPSRTLVRETVPLPGMDATFEIADDVVRWYSGRELEWSDVMEHRAAATDTLRRFDEAMFSDYKAAPTDTKRADEPSAVAARDGVFRGTDGVTVRLGPSWSEELMEREPERRG